MKRIIAAAIGVVGLSGMLSVVGPAANAVDTLGEVTEIPAVCHHYNRSKFRFNVTNQTRKGHWYKGQSATTGAEIPSASPGYTASVYWLAPGERTRFVFPAQYGFSTDFVIYRAFSRTRPDSGGVVIASGRRAGLYCG